MTTNAELWTRRQAAVSRGVNTAHPVFAARALNAEIWDVEGKRYIDFVGGIGVQNTGHRHPKVVKAIEAQLQNTIHTAFQVNAYESYIALAEKLNALAPRRRPGEVDFLLDRRRSGRERGQARTLRHEALGGDRFLRRLPRPHALHNGADRQDRALQSGLRRHAVRRLPPALPRRKPRPHRKAIARSA
jgi:hypothetical protein